MSSIFQFKHFTIHQEKSAMKVGTDSMILGAVVPVDNKITVLDIGTGTGILSLMLAQKSENLKIIALEIDQQASEEAFLNVQNALFQNEIEILNINFFDFNPNIKFDLIISNPPFFERSLKSMDNQRNLARHTETLPLLTLVPKVEQILEDKGDFWMILPAKLANDLIFEIENKKSIKTSLKLKKEISIFGKPNQMIRKIVCFSKFVENLEKMKLTVRDEEGKYTKEYKKLTENYHNKKI